MPNDNELLKETYRLAKENNKMLHAMRRSAFLHGLIKLIFYAAIAGGSIWFYLHFVAPILLQTLETLNKIQGAGTQAQGQFADWTSQLEKLKALLPGTSSTSAK